MELSSLKFYEGNNIKRQKRIVKVAINESNKHKIYTFIKNYIKVCFSLELQEKLVDMELEKGITNVWLSYHQEELSEYLITNLIYESKDLKYLFENALKLKINDFLFRIISRAEKFKIPVIKLGENVFQLGYGSNSVIVNNEFQSYEKNENVKVINNMKSLWQNLRYNNIPKVPGEIIYNKCQINDFMNMCFPLNIMGVEKSQNFYAREYDWKTYKTSAKRFLNEYIKIFVSSGEINYRVVVYKGKVGLVLKVVRDNTKNKLIYKIVEPEEKLLEFCRKIYESFKIEFMYIDLNHEEELKVLDMGSVFQLQEGLSEIGDKTADFFLNSLREEGIGYIPIIAVSGTNGKTTTCRLIHYIMNKLGYVTGLACTGGIIIGNKKISSGDTTGFLSTRKILTNPDVEAAVLEIARGGILRNGLGYENGKAAVITSLSEDHIGMENIRCISDLAEIKSVIFDELDENSKIIVKAEEKLINAAFRNNIYGAYNYYHGRTKNKNNRNVVLFSINRNFFIDEYIENGGEALYLQQNYIIYCCGGVERKLLNIKDLNFTLRGCSKGNILNIMAACAAVSVVNNDIEKIVGTLKDIKCDLYFNPGRQNLLEIKDFKVILDYGHNSEAFREVFNIAKSLNPSKITSIIAAPGDRMDKYIRELGEISAENSDFIIIREQADLRGRDVGESASLIRKGVLKSGFNSKNLLTIYKEEEAIVYAMERAVSGEIIILFTQCLNVIVPAINNYLKKIGEKEIAADIDF